MRIKVTSRYNEVFDIKLNHRVSLITDLSATKKTYFTKLITGSQLTKNMEILDYNFDIYPTCILFNSNNLLNQYGSAIKYILGNTEETISSIIKNTTLNDNDFMNLPKNKILVEYLNKQKFINKLDTIQKLKLVKFFIIEIKKYWSNINCSLKNSIIIIDDEEFISSIELTRFINCNLDNYFLIIGRDSLSGLSHDVNSIYLFEEIEKNYIKNTLKINTTNIFNK